MIKYNITMDDMNKVRYENGLPWLFSEAQMTQERALVKEGKGGTRQYTQAPPRPPTPPPTPEVKAEASERKPKNQRSVFNLSELKRCIERDHPTEQPNGKGPYAASTIKRNAIEPGQAMEWWAQRIEKHLGIDVKINENTDVCEWLHDNAQRIADLAPQLTHLDFPQQNADMRLNMAVKQKVTRIMGAFRYFPRFGQFMRTTYPETVEILSRVGEQARKKESDELYDAQEKRVAKPWGPSRLHAFEASENGRPKAKDALNKHYDYIILQMWASAEGYPLRDQMGNVRIVRSKKDVAVKKNAHIQYNVDTGDEEPVHDYYVLNEKQFIWRSHKTRAHTDDVIQKAPAGVHGAILISLRNYPRDWLIAKLDNIAQPYGKGIAAFLRQPHVLGMGVNDARHAYITWWMNQKKRSNKAQKAMATAMMTGRADFSEYEWRLPDAEDAEQ
jgi:hypothetical protein